MRWAAVPAAEFERRARALTSQPHKAHSAHLLTAAADGVALAMVYQAGDPFRLPDDRPAVLIVGNDLDTSLGPEAFHLPNLRWAQGVAVMAGAPVAQVYATAAEAGRWIGATVVLIECRETMEGERNAFAEKAAAQVPRLIVTPADGAGGA